jgi:NADH:ubiquinone oxidoreductase subunit 4 (subunit M)
MSLMSGAHTKGYRWRIKLLTMLLTLFLLPLVGALIIVTMSDTTAEDLSRIKKTTLVITLITFVLSMVM